MESIFLSFNAEWYEPLKDGLKIFEHRKRFGKDNVLAYIYLGKPYQKIVAEIELGERVLLSEWLDTYKDNKDTVDRIYDFMKRNTYAMPVIRFRELKDIQIKELQVEFPDFRIPRSYIYLDRKPEILKWINNKKRYTGYEKYNDFTKITHRDICQY